MNTLAGKIRFLREQQGLSQRALAEASGVSAAALSQIEAGNTSPSVATLEKLADGLGIAMAAFFLDSRESSDIEIFAMDDRPAVALGGGSHFVPLTALHQPVGFEPMLVRLMPGGSFNEEEYGIRSAHLFVWVRRARAILDYDGRNYEVHETQSLFYDARKPHNWRNPFEEATELLMVRSR
ncbi:MAG TPA: helix-turn-helix domain-containing protein [Mariprofundaceae bacterium]|nr:helix-turn-helix domain-containing protein [Mariprofundaceae bacterium]